MKKLTIIAVSTLIALVAHAEPTLELRKSPDAKAPIVGEIKKDSPVEISLDKWVFVKNLDTNKNIGYQYGILYENDCLGIDFNYYRDLTKDRDIKESDGFSFTIVLKPFGSTNNYGKNKVFGPRI